MRENLEHVSTGKKIAVEIVAGLLLINLMDYIKTRILLLRVSRKRLYKNRKLEV